MSRRERHRQPRKMFPTKKVTAAINATTKAIAKTVEAITAISAMTANATATKPFSVFESPAADR